MTSLLAIDPGTTDSAFVVMDDGELVSFNILPNQQVLDLIQRAHVDFLAVEQMQGYGMNVGNEVFRTCEWTGRFLQAWDMSRGVARNLAIVVGRKEVKLHICGSNRANDAAVSHAIAERYGFDSPKQAKGTKANPGPLYGVRADVWAALAVALTVVDTKLMPPTKKRGRYAI
jgi:hypothetical protein